MTEIRTIDTLKALINKKSGLAKPTRFLAQISLPFAIGTKDDASDLSLFCQTTQLPTRLIQTVEYAGTQRHSFSIPSGFKNDTITCTFLVGADFFPKNLFDDWMALSVDTVSYRVQYVDAYSATFNLYQLDQSDNIVYGVELQEAFPITISPIEMNAGSVNEVHKMSVTFSYYDAVPIPKEKFTTSQDISFQGETSPAIRAANFVPAGQNVA